MFCMTIFTDPTTSAWQASGHARSKPGKLVNNTCRAVIAT